MNNIHGFMMVPQVHGLNFSKATVLASILESDASTLFTESDLTAYGNAVGSGVVIVVNYVTQVGISGTPWYTVP